MVPECSDKSTFGRRCYTTILPRAFALSDAVFEHLYTVHSAQLLFMTCRKRRARESIKSAATVSEPTPYVSLVQPWLQAPTSAQLLKQPQRSKVGKQSNSSLAKPGNVIFPANRKAGLSTMGLTPGTPLMAEIERSLEFYICQRLQRWKHLNFELSGARVQVRLYALCCL